MMNGEIATREDYELHLQPLQGAPGPTGVFGRARPGILIYSHKRRLLHVNSRALEMRCPLDRVDTESTGMALASSVNEIRIQLQGIMESRGEASIGELVESKRVLVEDGREILVRGFGLASRQSHGDFRIVIVLEEENVRQDHQPRQARLPSSTRRCTIFSEKKPEA
jgi:hypothetical protein